MFRINFLEDIILTLYQWIVYVSWVSHQNNNMQKQTRTDNSIQNKKIDQNSYTVI